MQLHRNCTKRSIHPCTPCTPHVHLWNVEVTPDPAAPLKRRWSATKLPASPRQCENWGCKKTNPFPTFHRRVSRGGCETHVNSTPGYCPTQRPAHIVPTPKGNLDDAGVSHIWGTWCDLFAPISNSILSPQMHSLGQVGIEQLNHVNRSAHILCQKRWTGIQNCMACIWNCLCAGCICLSL